MTRQEPCRGRQSHEADRPEPETFTLHVYDGGQAPAAPADTRPAAAKAVLTYVPERGLYRQFCPVPLYSATEIVLLPGAIRATYSTPSR